MSSFTACTPSKKVEETKALVTHTKPVRATRIPSILERGSNQLKPGQFIWQPEASPSGPVLVVVSLPEQLAHVYRNGVSIGVSTVSSGRKGHVTPTGVFTILEKKEKAFSNLYNNAPMPFMERLTWDGIALHAGNLPGYPASHGCVRLPKEFAQRLYSVTEKGLTVVVADDEHFGQTLVHPGLLAPVSPDAKSPEELAIAEKDGFTWEPGAATSGPIAILITSAGSSIYAYRNGVEIGRARLNIEDPQQPLGHAVYHMLEGLGEDPSPILPDRPAHRWMRVHFKAGGQGAGTSTVASRVKMPRKFAESLYSSLEPGTTLQVTDLPLSGQNKTPPGFVVLAGHDFRTGG